MSLIAIISVLALAVFVCPSGATFWGEGSDSDASLQCAAHSRQMLQVLLSQQACSSSDGCLPSMVCVGGKCGACSSDVQCSARNSQDRCTGSSTEHSRLCAHKTFWVDFGASDILLIIIVFFSTALSAPTGTGGGGIMVPVFMLLCGFTAQDAIPLSKATIFGLALSNNFLNMQKKHPSADRPLIDYDVICMLQPMLLLGTIVGVFLNAVSPNWLITVCLILVLSFTVYRTALKAQQFYLEESRSDSSAPSESSPLVAHDPDLTVASADITSVSESDANLINSQKDMFPLSKFSYMMATWLAIFGSAVVKGGEGTKGFVDCGSSAYWAVVLLPATVALPLTYSHGREMLMASERKKQLGMKTERGDIKWDSKRTALYPAICFACGIAAGALGIAAGMILSPLLLEMGMSPAVAAATSGFAVLFTSSCTSLQFLVLGHLSPSYGIVCCLTGFVGAFVGNSVISYYIQKYKKTYVIVALLTGILALSVCLLAYTGISNLVKSIENGEEQGFTPLCDHGIPSDIENAAFIGNVFQ